MSTRAVAGTALVSAALAIAASLAIAQSSTDAGKTKKKPISGDPYLLSVDPVSGEKLDPAKTPVARTHEGRTILFASEETAKRFDADPRAVLLAVDRKMTEAQSAFYPTEDCPVSGHATGGEPIEIVHRNRLVRLCCTDCLTPFKKDPGPYLAKLDAAAIAAQKADYPLGTCPVSGEKLGSMGEPLDVVAGHRLFRFCCGGCLEKFHANPQAVVAKVDAAAKAKE